MLSRMAAYLQRHVGHADTQKAACVAPVTGVPRNSVCTPQSWNKCFSTAGSLAQWVMVGACLLLCSLRLLQRKISPDMTMKKGAAA